MPPRPLFAVILGAWSTLPCAAGAQQVPVPGEGVLVLPRTTTLSVQEPRAFPAGGQLEARPLPPPPSPGARRSRVVQPPVNFRLVAAEEYAASPAAKPPLRLAPRSESSRPSLAKPLAHSPGAAIGTVAGSLGIVLGVFFVLAWCTRRLNPGATSLLPNEAVEVLGRAPLAGRQQMQLVRVGHKLLLVAITPSGVVPLTEINDAAEIEHLSGLCRRGQSSSASAAFREALQQLSSERAPPGFVAAAPPTARGAR